MARFSYIDYENMVTCPIPWSSKDEGELWLADDYFMTLVRYPQTRDSIVRRTIPALVKQFIAYPYALLVFHKIDLQYREPLPIFVLTLERSFEGLGLDEDLAETVDEYLDSQGDPDDPVDVFFCMFQNPGHYNFGIYRNKMNVESVREAFFNELNSLLYLKSAPRKAGEMMDAFGHPETGLKRQN